MYNQKKRIFKARQCRLLTSPKQIYITGGLEIQDAQALGKTQDKFRSDSNDHTSTKKARKSFVYFTRERQINDQNTGFSLKMGISHNLMSTQPGFSH